MKIKEQKESGVLIYQWKPIYWLLTLLPQVLGSLIYKYLPSFSWLRVILLFIATLPMDYVAIKTFQIIKNYYDVANFDDIKEKTIRSLKKLGCDPKVYGIQ